MTTADDLAAAAAAVRRHGPGLPGVLHEVERGFGNDTWVGPAADRFRAALAQHRARLTVVEEDLGRVARVLQARADDGRNPARP
jgi:hypothetical protein